MATIKTAARSASVAFAPTNPSAIALATQDGALDASFSATASLDVFTIDFASPVPELELLSSLPSTEKFNSISWGTTGAGSEEYPYGLLAGGLSDGTVCVYNPAPLIREDSNTGTSLVAHSQKHGGRVRGLEFNVLMPNLLASGGDDGDLYIWDLVNPTVPSHFPALKGADQDHIIDVSWNRKVQQILATTSNNGVSVVWDLRRQKSILSFPDLSNRRPCAALEWNPDGATELIIASADDRSPALQVWDLRKSISPVKELVGHTKGVVAMGWCPIDSALLLSSAKDYRTVCWDTTSGEIVCELPVSSNWNFDVQWSPRVAGVFSTSSYDGRVNLYNIEACSRTLPSEGHFGGSVGTAAFAATMRAPKWLKRPAGVTFGFGGKLVTFSVKKGAQVSELTIQSYVMEEDIIKRSKDFEASIRDFSERSSLRALCERKAQESGSEGNKEVWSFLKVLFEEKARTSLLGHLGFGPSAAEGIEREGLTDGVESFNADITNKLNVSCELSEIANEVIDSVGVPQMNGQQDSLDDGADFFNNLSTPKGAVSPLSIPKAGEASGESMLLQEESQEDGLEEEDECDRTVQHALVRGDFKDAVKQCLSENRMADALALAHVGGSELWEETLAVYLKKHKRPYRKVLAAVVVHDLGNLVNTRPLTAWRETLALLCSYAGSQDWALLCDALAARLDAAGLTQAAVLCYICAGNVEELARLWYRDVLMSSNSASFAKEMQEVMEKIVMLALANGEKRVSPSLARFVGSYAEFLASQGATTTALEYLCLVPPEESPEELVILRDRIASSKQGEARADDYHHYMGSAQAIPTISSAPASHQTLQPSYGTSQQGMYYGSSQILPDQAQANTFVPQETTYGQPPSYPQAGMFLPTQPQGLDRSQPPPSVYQRSFTPPNSFPTTTPPNTGSFVPPFRSRVGTVSLSSQFTGAIPPPTQFQGTGNVVGPPNQPTSQGPTQWDDGYGFQPQFQATAGGKQTDPAVMFPGAPTASITATPSHGGFMPMSAPRAPLTQHQPGLPMQAVQPQSPSSLSPPRAQQVPAMAAPPVTIQSVDTGAVPADLKPVVASLSRLYKETAEALGSSKKREVEDNSKKLGGLFAKLNSADISPNARAKLIQICQSIDAGDYATASQLQVSLTTSDWDECGSWLGPLKRMIKLRQSLR